MSNKDFIQGLYDNFAAGDVPAAGAAPLVLVAGGG